MLFCFPSNFSIPAVRLFNESNLSPVLPVNCPYILYFITEFQCKVKKSQSYSFVTF